MAAIVEVQSAPFEAGRILYFDAREESCAVGTGLFELAEGLAGIEPASLVARGHFHAIHPHAQAVAFCGNRGIFGILNLETACANGKLARLFRYFSGHWDYVYRSQHCADGKHIHISSF